MTMSDEIKRRRVARAAFGRRLVRQVALGAAGAAGSATVTLLLWWLTGR